MCQTSRTSASDRVREVGRARPNSHERHCRRRQLFKGQPASRAHSLGGARHVRSVRYRVVSRDRVVQDASTSLSGRVTTHTSIECTHAEGNMADSGIKRNIPIKLGDFSVIDTEFSNIRERFDAEMRKMEDEMSRFRSELMNRESNNFFKSTTRYVRATSCPQFALSRLYSEFRVMFRLFAQSRLFTSTRYVYRCIESFTGRQREIDATLLTLRVSISC